MEENRGDNLFFPRFLFDDEQRLADDEQVLVDKTVAAIMSLTSDKTYSCPNVIVQHFSHVNFGAIHKAEIKYIGNDRWILIHNDKKLYLGRFKGKYKPENSKTKEK